MYTFSSNNKTYIYDLYAPVFIYTFNNTVNVKIFIVTIFRLLKFREDKFPWVSWPTIITVANCSCVQIFVGLIFMGVAKHEN